MIRLFKEVMGGKPDNGAVTFRPGCPACEAGARPFPWIRTPREGEWWLKKACSRNHGNTPWSMRPFRWAYTPGDWKPLSLGDSKDWKDLFEAVEEACRCGCLAPAPDVPWTSFPLIPPISRGRLEFR